MLVAILFDLDGTLVNTDPIHYQAWREVLSSYGVEIDEEIYKSRFSGRLNPQIVADFLPQLSAAAAVKVVDEKEALFRKMTPKLQATAGLAELLQWTQVHGLKRGLVTNAPKLNAQHMLAALKLEDAFNTVVIAGGDITGKPDPAPYQVALQQLGFKPEHAIAIEDSPSGICSAVAAKILTIGITSTHNGKCLRDMGASIAISDFTDLQLWALLNSLLDEDLVSTMS